MNAETQQVIKHFQTNCQIRLVSVDLPRYQETKPSQLDKYFSRDEQPINHIKTGLVKDVKTLKI